MASPELLATLPRLVDAARWITARAAQGVGGTPVREVAVASWTCIRSGRSAGVADQAAGGSPGPEAPGTAEPAGGALEPISGEP